MKKVLFLICLLGTASIFAGAAFPSVISKSKEVKITGCGYTIVEFGKGIDCNGDTVKLERAKGFQHFTAIKKNDHRGAI